MYNYPVHWEFSDCCKNGKMETTEDWRAVRCEKCANHIVLRLRKTHNQNPGYNLKVGDKVQLFSTLEGDFSGPFEKGTLATIDNIDNKRNCPIGIKFESGQYINVTAEDIERV